MDPTEHEHFYQPQSCFALDEQDEHPLHRQKAQSLQENEPTGYLSPLQQHPLDRDFKATRPNQKWVTDITYILTQQGWAYLSTIKDLFDSFIVAHQLGQQNSVCLVTNTLKQAKRKEKVTDGLLLHSDQGTQYTSQAYFVLTREYNITPSMSRHGNCWDNAPMENFFGHLKEEALHQLTTPTFEQAKRNY